jgi:hypothetical protein
LTFANPKYGTKKPPKPLQSAGFGGFHYGTPEGTRTPNPRNRKSVKGVVAQWVLGF